MQKALGLIKSGSYEGSDNGRRARVWDGGIRAIRRNNGNDLTLSISISMCSSAGGMGANEVTTIQCSLPDIPQNNNAVTRDISPLMSADGME